MDVCGLRDLEHKGAFEGPEYEGDPFDLCSDFITCSLWAAPAPIPKHFDEAYVHKLMHPPKHHGHGEHSEHSHGGHEVKGTSLAKIIKDCRFVYSTD